MCQWDRTEIKYQTFADVCQMIVGLTDCFVTNMGRKINFLEIISIIRTNIFASQQGMSAPPGVGAVRQATTEIEGLGFK